MIESRRKPSELEIRAAKLSDAGDFASHVVRHLAESGVHGQHFGPVSVVRREDVLLSSESRWGLSLSQPGWARVWILVATVGNDRRVVGHVELRGSDVAAALHRAGFSIGIEAPFRNQGHGSRLSEVALAFSRQSGAIEWIDLRVFATNTRALKMYEKMGFARVGVVEDAYCMADGVRIDDVWMVRRMSSRDDLPPRK